MEILFSGQYEKKSYYQGVFRIFRPKRSVHIFRIALFVVFAGIFVYLAVTEVRGGGLDTTVIFRLGRIFFTFVGLLFFVLQPYLSSYQTANRLWSDPFIHKPIEGRVTNQGIEYGSYIQYWEDFAKKNVQDDLVVLLTAKQVMSILPRSFFTSGQDWERFTELVEYKVKEAK